MRILLLAPLLVACSAEREAPDLEPTEAPDVATVTPEAEATPTASPTEAPIATPSPTPTPVPTPTPDPYDVDGDGWRVAPGTSWEENDCNDVDPATHPGAFEWCDGVDQNCIYITYTDETSPVDTDRDGFVSCSWDPTVLTDCRPDSKAAYPGAYEYQDDHYDSNCNGRDY